LSPAFFQTTTVFSLNKHIAVLPMSLFPMFFLAIAIYPMFYFVKPQSVLCVLVFVGTNFKCQQTPLGTSQLYTICWMECWVGRNLGWNMHIC
jgi:hypothetical protein